MKSFHLKAVEYEGKRFANCTLVIDANAQKAQIKRAAGLFGRGVVPLADLSWGPGTTVQVEGATIRSGAVTFVADDEKSAQEISFALQGRTARSEQLEDKIKGLRGQVSAFLRMRAEGIGFLEELRKDPRQALVDKSQAYTGRYENPALEYLMKFATTLAESHAKMTYAAAEVQEAVGAEAIDRIFGFVCAVGSMQDGFAVGTGSTEELVSFLKELGVDPDMPLGSDVSAATESLLQRSEPLFSPSIAPP